MSLEGFSAKWFLIYYVVFGLFMIGLGLWLIIKKHHGKAFLIKKADNEKPPTLFIRILKYLLLFSLPGLVLSFFPFSWVELIFSLWSLFIVFLLTNRLVHWKQTTTLIQKKKDKLPVFLRRAGAIMVSVGLVMFLLAYLVIQKVSI